MGEKVERLEDHADVSTEVGELLALGRQFFAIDLDRSAEVIVSRRLIVRQSVDLPEPEGPITTTTSPAFTVRSMSVRAWKSP